MAYNLQLPSRIEKRSPLIIEKFRGVRLKKYIAIVTLTVFLLSLSINVSAISQFASEIVEGSTASIPEPTTLILFGIGLIGLAGSRDASKK